MRASMGPGRTTPHPTALPASVCMPCAEAIAKPARRLRQCVWTPEGLHQASPIRARDVETSCLEECRAAPKHTRPPKRCPRSKVPQPLVDALAGASGELAQILALYPLETIKVGRVLMAYGAAQCPLPRKVHLCRLQTTPHRVATLPPAAGPLPGRG